MAQIQKQTRVVYWLLKSLFKRYNKLIIFGFLAGLGVMLIGVYFWGPIKTLLFPQKTVIGLVGAYEPERLPLFIQQKISRGFTQIEDNGTPKEDLAMSWEVSKEGTRYFYHLQKGLLWHDGTEFTAHDVNYNFKDVVIAPADRYTLKVELNEPFAPLPTLLSRPLFKSGLIGLGEYQVVRLERQGPFVESLLLQSVPQTALSDSYQKKLIEYRFYPTQKDAALSFQLGEVDSLDYLNSIPSELEKENNVTISKKVLDDRYLGLFFNLQHDPLGEKELRQALSYATPALDGERVLSPISDKSWAYNASVRDYSYDMDLAKSTLEKAKFNGVEVTLSTFPEYLQYADQIVKSWKEAGVNAQVRIVHALPVDYEVFLGVQEIPSDPDQYPMWHSTQEQSNITHYNNPKIDKLLEEGRKTLDQDKRAEIYREFQRYLVEDVPVHFLIHPVVYTITRK